MERIKDDERSMTTYKWCTVPELCNVDDDVSKRKQQEAKSSRKENIAQRVEVLIHGNETVILTRLATRSKTTTTTLDELTSMSYPT